MVKNKRDAIWTELMKYDRKVWTVQDMQERVDQEIHPDTIRSVFHSAVEADLMEHEANTPTYYLN